MLKYLTILLICFSIILSSCQTIELTPIENENTEISTKRGQQFALDKTMPTPIVVSSTRIDDKVAFTVTMVNLTNHTIKFHERDVFVEQGDILVSDKKRIRYWSATQYLSKVKREETTESILLAITAGLNSATAGYSTSSTYGNFSGNSTYGSYSGTYTGTTTTYDPAAAQIAYNQNMQMLENQQRSSNNLISFLENSLLFTSEIEPGKSYSGLVFAEVPNKPNMFLSITVEGRKYSFTFEREDSYYVRNPTAGYPSNKWFVGYSLGMGENAPLSHGFEFGVLTHNLGVEFDFRYSPKDGSLKGYDSNTYEEYNSNTGTVDGVGDYVLRGEKIADFYDISFLLNYRITPILWLNGGLGYRFNREYYLFDHYFSTGSYWDTLWIEDTIDNDSMLYEAGLRFAIKDITLKAGWMGTETDKAQFSFNAGWVF